MDEHSFFHFSVSVFSLFIRLCFLCSLPLSYNLLLVEYEVIYYLPEPNFQNDNVQMGPTWGMSQAYSKCVTRHHFGA